MTDIKATTSTLWEVETELRRALRSALLLRRDEARQSWRRARNLVDGLSKSVLARKDDDRHTSDTSPAPSGFQLNPTKE